ncbi:hypothetical protein [Thermodesulfovibrio thiophilus]|nr:hypothetical protein [Thermodesulfovibrio thiophilus]
MQIEVIAGFGININKKFSSKMQQYAHIASIAMGLSLRGTEKIK